MEMAIQKKLSFSFSATTGVNPNVPMMHVEIPIQVVPTGRTTGTPEAALRGMRGVHRVFFNPTTRRLSVWYFPKDVDVLELYRAVKDAGYQTDTSTMRLRIKGIYCSGCISIIENVLRQVPGVAAAVLNPATAEAAVEYYPQSTDLSELEKAVDSLGMYSAEPAEAASPEGVSRGEEDADREYRSLMRKWWFAAGVGIFTMFFSYPQLIPGLRELLPKGSDQLRYLWMAMGIASLAVMVFSGNLSQADRQAVDDYLMGKYFGVPEPITLSLLALGGLALLRRRKHASI